jgi:hypothetical protein
LRNNQLIPDYEKHEEKIMEVLKETAQVEATLTTKMFHMIDNKNMREVEQAISAIIGQLSTKWVISSAKLAHCSTVTAYMSLMVISILSG